MDKEFVIHTIAENGLETAAAYFFAAAGKLQHQADAEADPTKKALLLKTAAGKQKLAAALQGADAGIKSYQQAVNAA